MKNMIKKLIIFLVLIFIYAPILILIFYSFTDSTQIGAVRGFSLQNYVTLFTTEELRNMIIGTVLLALVSSCLATVLGTLGAIGSFYSNRKTAGFFGTINQIPVINADVVTGFSICILLVVVLNISKDTYIPLVIGHMVLSAPFVYLSVLPKLKQMDPSIYEAALDLGATPATALQKIVIPQIMPGILSGFAMAITLSLDDYFIATYTKPAAFDTISTYVVNATKGSQTSIKTALWALSAVIFLIVVIFVVFANLSSGKKEDMKKSGLKTGLSLLLVICCLSGLLAHPGETALATEAGDGEEVVLRVCNWEEYIDLGDWDEDETIELDSGDIIGVNTIMDDFEDWYYETTGTRVRVEYSCFGTNEDLYNMLTLGDVYDLVCPSEYMFMKLMAEDKLVPLSDDFFDESKEENYYVKGISPFIRQIFDSNEIEGKPWSSYAAGYMWGVTGFVYNPDVVSEEDASTWKLMGNKNYSRQITIKDNVRDSFFAAVGAVKSDLLTSDEFKNDPDYTELLKTEMNDTSQENLDQVLSYLQKCKNNLYSFETDSGKADMITGKVVANYQWSGDAVYTMDQADEDDYTLNFAVPEESTNIYFDGWVMLKSGVEGDRAKQQAAEAFINFLSRPDNVIRNMYYIGYTSVIAGGSDTRVFDYLDYNYGAEEGEEDTVEYPVGFFFTGDNSNEDYILTVPVEQTKRQLYAQYPSEDVLNRSSIMIYFDQEVSERINQMWINVRCFNITALPLYARVTILLAVIACIVLLLAMRRKRWTKK